MTFEFLCLRASRFVGKSKRLELKKRDYAHTGKKIKRREKETDMPSAPNTLSSLTPYDPVLQKDPGGEPIQSSFCKLAQQRLRLLVIRSRLEG